MFGPDLLAAPVRTPGETSRELYLPERPMGRLLAGGLLRGGLGIAGSRPRRAARRRALGHASRRRSSELPLMVRAGAVLPLLPATVDTLASYGSDSPRR